jgi:DNA-binding NarL/FixJ family response regulator
MDILVVDDHAVVRSGVLRLLATLPNAKVAEAETAQEALALFKARAFDVYVLDINLKDSSGLELLRRLRIERPGAKVVIFSMYSEVAYAMSARRAGALGYVSKSAPVEELLAAVRKAARGESYVDDQTAHDLADASITPADAVKLLSNRELEILRLLGEGKSLAEIADVLGIAYKTVANTSSRIKEKLGLDRTGDLIRLAVETLHTKVT